jgi:hypothetical protein
MSEFLDIDNDGLLEQTGQLLNMIQMKIGDVKYCFFSFWFEISGNSSFYLLGEGQPTAIVQVKVEQDLLGNPVWVLKPLKNYPYNGQSLDFLNRKLWLHTRNASCDQGVYSMDFELRLALK